MLLSSLTALLTLPLPLFTFAFATRDRRANVLHDKRFGSANLHAESALGASGRHASGDLQDGLGSPPYYLTDKWQGQNFFNGWTFFTNRYIYVGHGSIIFAHTAMMILATPRMDRLTISPMQQLLPRSLLTWIITASP